MLVLAILFWMIKEMSAPIWCWVLWWICIVIKSIEIAVKVLK